ncbi:MAG: glycoside hydrolase family 9 protein [Bacteroidetes bacterium]|nr:glycoside hydrolase family 9 protein [Bacteroidota bacterium]
MKINASHIKRYISLFLTTALFFAGKKQPEEQSWIRINLMGYLPHDTKVAVWCSKQALPVSSFEVMDVQTGKTIYTAKASRPFGAWGPFTQTCRLDFSAFTREGNYIIKAGSAASPEFHIGNNVYEGAADFCLRYMRQQRSGFNPFLKDSCHTQDGYTMYGPMPDSTHIDVSGGWHDASDYLQYVTTSANATWHLLAAWRDYPEAFGDTKQANGLDGKNGRADVLDEAKWGLDWLLKMHPRDDWMFSQLGDDRDHQGMRIPGLDSFYGKGFERPVYFLTGEPQGLGKYKNRTTGTTSTAAKFSSAFALGSQLFRASDTAYSNKLWHKAITAKWFSMRRKGVSQTAPNKAPYFYEEDNWMDDEELMEAQIAQMNIAAHRVTCGNEFDHLIYSRAKEKITPWLGEDTAKHYQWYPFINPGHYEFIRLGKSWQIEGIKEKYTEALGWYKQGIERVWAKAQHNAFYRGVPFIWCSNNLTTAFAIQCLWYRQLSGDNRFHQLEQANIDWLFGCNPWGTSFIYGLPGNGDTPTDPHSAFTHIGHYPIDGGLVDGPVYGSIFRQLKGITMYKPDAYAPFQSDLVVYHDDYGDYSTNEPTMDGTASLVYLLAARQSQAGVAINNRMVSYTRGAVTRGDSAQAKIALVFTGDEYAESGAAILKALTAAKAKASFFFTGRFYRNPAFKTTIKQLRAAGHYLGPHSGEHLLYCDWNKRDSLLVTKEQFNNDLTDNYKAMAAFGISSDSALFFLPPYEWYNDSIAHWTKQRGLQLVNYTPGTLSHADYTTAGSKGYRSTDEIYRSIMDHDQYPNRLNGYILLLHIGAGPGRTDKFSRRLPELLRHFRENHYKLVTLPRLLD